MGGNGGKKAREELLAAKLRENLRRRKARSRAQGDERPGGMGDRGLPKAGDEG